ncbi:MAG: DNA polymerase IV, partial [Oscillospiraceae bacterium]|nr:DNA polymerase IV [Oscillospiraceae bacterium]
MKPVIFHVDVNSAFLSWTAAERLRQGDPLDLRAVPSAIAGDIENRHGIILAKSTPARAFGVKTGEPIWQAIEKCPELMLARPDYALYVRQSRRFVALLREVAPIVEQYSIDEAWADMSGTQWSRGDPLEAAEALRLRVKRELGFTVNIGISTNKLLAKMAGDFQKPDKIHTLYPHELETKLWPLPVRELFSVGPATERKLAFFGIHTIGELANSDPDFLRARLHKHGELIWHYANGRGDCRVNPVAEANKGYGNSVTTARDVTDTLSAHRVLLSLCETVGARMRSDGQTGRVVMVHIRNGALEDSSH